MSRRFQFAVLLLLFASSGLAGPDEEFAAVVAAIQRGDQLVQQGNDRPALEEYRKAQESLLKFRTVYPQWDPQVVSFRLRYLGERLGNGAEPDPGKPSTADSELKALQGRVQFLERSGQQYQAQINQLLSENGRLSVRLREALAIRPAALEPVAVMDTQYKLEAANKEVEKLKLRVKELEIELAGIPKPDEARKNARLLEETRKSLNQAVGEVESLRKQVAELQQPRPAAAVKAPAASLEDAQLQAARVTQSAAEMELLRLRGENDKLRAQLAAAATAPEPEALQAPRGSALNRMDRARLAMADERWAEARQLLEIELKADQDNAEAWYLLGRVRLETGDFSGASRALRQAIEISPELGVAHREFARLQLRQPAPDLALSRWHYHRALGLGAPRDLGFEMEIGWEQPSGYR